MNKQKEFQRIAEEIKRCRACKKGGTGLPVPGEGSGEVPVMFVGEAPGRNEAKTGRPFIGRSGQLLRQTIRDIGLEESKVFITSPVHYLPKTGKPSPSMIDHGRSHLLKQIKVIEPHLIVLLGNTACRALLGQNAKIAQEHGTVIEQDGINYFISFHPAYAIRFPEGKEKFIKDFRKLKSILKRI